ncbi:MAG: hypothetical protein ABR588_10370 [Sphingomicrobium sp.]
MVQVSGSLGSRVVSLVLAFVLGAAAFCLILWTGGVRPVVRQELSSIDIVTMVLGALGVMVAILTLFLGVLALFGWTAFRSIIEERFDHKMRERFNPANDEYKELLKNVVEDAKSIQLTKSSQTEVPALKAGERAIEREI